MAVLGGYLLRTRGTANGQTLNAISSVLVPTSSHPALPLANKLRTRCQLTLGGLFEKTERQHVGFPPEISVVNVYRLL
jgi:hypothetical protein